MINKKLLLVLLILLTGTVLFSRTVLAHVLIGDDTKSVGAVLHVTPDDDPIAGRQSTLFFNVQVREIAVAGTKLTVVDAATGQTVAIPIKIDAHTVTADYTFPVQGVYRLRLIVNSTRVYVFNYSQRVSRGAAGSALDKPAYPLANLALVLSGTAFLLLLVVLFNRRQAVWRRSTF